MLMAAWLTFRNHDIRDFWFVGVFWSFYCKICYSEHVDLFMIFYLAKKSIFITRISWLKMVPIHFSVSKVSLEIKKHSSDPGFPELLG